MVTTSDLRCAFHKVVGPGAQLKHPRLYSVATSLTGGSTAIMLFNTEDGAMRRLHEMTPEIANVSAVLPPDPEVGEEVND